MTLVDFRQYLISCLCVLKWLYNSALFASRIRSYLYDQRYLVLSVIRCKIFVLGDLCEMKSYNLHLPMIFRLSTLVSFPLTVISVK